MKEGIFFYYHYLNLVYDVSVIRKEKEKQEENNDVLNICDNLFRNINIILYIRLI